MAGELKWQRYFMDAPVKNSRFSFYAVFNRSLGPAIATARNPGLVVSFANAPEIVSLMSDGKVRWKRRLEAPVRLLALEGEKDSLMVALAGGILYHIDPAGKPLWKFRLSGEITALTASEKGSCVAAADDKGKLVMLNLDGKLIFNIKTEATVKTLKVSQDGSTLLASDAAGAVMTISRDGKVVWRKVFSDGVGDVATTAGCTKTLVLSKTVRSLMMDGSERWAVEVPGASAVRMSDDGDASFVLSPGKLTRINPMGRVMWERDIKSIPESASVMPRSKMLVLVSADGTVIYDRWGNLALECPLPGPSPGTGARTIFDGDRTLYCLRESDKGMHLLMTDAGPSLVEYLLKAAKAFGEECGKVNQASPFGEKHFNEAVQAASASEYTRALDNALFSYRFYEETLSSIGRPTGQIVNPESLGRAEVTARKDLEKAFSGRKVLYQAKCGCGNITPIFSGAVPLLVPCQSCRKLGLIKKAP